MRFATLAACLSILAAAAPPAALRAQAVPKAPAATAPPPPSRTGGRLRKVDLNSAPKENLVFMLKIPEQVAAKIIAARPFRTKAQLVNQGIVSAEVYAAIKDKVVVKRPMLP
jgi:DNA uptake protein ComE-like DNA-binding protein